MIKTATIVPTYPPDFRYTIDLLKSYNEFSNNDIYLVFTNNDEYEKFKPLVDISYKYLVVDNEFVSKYPNNIINIKKFYALDMIINDYDYVGIFDSETIFVRTFDSDTIYPTIFNKKILKSNKSNMSYLTKGCAQELDLANNEKLKQQTENYSYYWWFNEICVYEKETYKEFSTYLNSLPRSKEILNNKSCFDYILYGIWLICFKDFNIKKYCTDRVFQYGAIEHNNEDSISKEFESYMDHNKNYESCDTIKAIIQLDR